MLSAKRFKFRRPVVGIKLIDGTAMLVNIPANSTVDVLSGPNENGTLHSEGLVYVLWEEQTVALFAADIEARGVEVRRQDKSVHKARKSTTA